MNTGNGRTGPFDLRLLLGLVLGVYGLVLLGVGLTDDASSPSKADGLPINLIIGGVLVVVALVFIVWKRLDR